MPKNILFVNVQTAITFDQRLTIKEQITQAITEAGHEETMYPIILEQGVTANVYDKDLVNKISQNTDAVTKHTEAITTLTSALLAVLGMDDGEPDQEGNDEQVL
jgi:hypothetical protein